MKKTIEITLDFIYDEENEAYIMQAYERHKKAMKNPEFQNYLKFLINAGIYGHIKSNIEELDRETGME